MAMSSSMTLLMVSTEHIHSGVEKQDIPKGGVQQSTPCFTEPKSDLFSGEGQSTR
jgi:hypothetical protein